MKFLVFVLVVRFIIGLLQNAGKKRIEVDENNADSIAHPAEFQVRGEG